LSRHAPHPVPDCRDGDGIVPAIPIALVLLLLGGGVPAPLALAIVAVSNFAVFHGYAHGTELPPGSDATAFSAGFVVATGLLHLYGIGLGYAGMDLAGRWPAGPAAVRLIGVAIAIAGVIFLHAAL
jgi:urease accessory protein